MTETTPRRRSSGVMFVALFLLSAVTLGLVATAIHGFVVGGWLIPFWHSMSDAQASIISQLIFFLAAAWASLLVPLLFGSQLRSLEDAADRAQETYDAIKRQLEESAAESRRQFSSISRYQQMALGYFSNDGVFTDLDNDEKKAFVENAWLSVEAKVADALSKLPWQTRRWVTAGGKYRSNPWWDRVKQSEALGTSYAAFRTISDGKWSASRGTVPTFEQLKSVNDALRELQDFQAPLDVVEAASPTSISPQALNNGGAPIIEGPTATQ